MNLRCPAGKSADKLSSRQSVRPSVRNRFYYKDILHLFGTREHLDALFEIR